MSQITIFGAGGRVGQRVVQLALAQDYVVLAFVHRSNPLATHSNLTIMQGDIGQTADVEKAVQGSAAVTSAVGSWHTASKDILTTTMQSVIPAMQTAGVKRLVSLTGSAAFGPDDQPRLLDRVTHGVFYKLAPKILDDGEAHMRCLAKSNLDWTVIRSPVMIKFGPHGRYRLANRLPRPWANIHYDDVAAALLGQIKSSEFIKQAPVIHRH